MIADAANEQLEKAKPPEAKRDPKDFNKLFWENRNGNKGPYEATGKKANNNSELYQDLHKIIKDKGGFCVLGSHKYWVFSNDPDMIGRRPR